jgi:DNA replication protein DnaC
MQLTKAKIKLSTSEPASSIPYAAPAPFDSYENQRTPLCLPDTRVDVLKDIITWADGQDERYNFWLNGLAGTGKSTVACTIARRYNEQKSRNKFLLF